MGLHRSAWLGLGLALALCPAVARAQLGMRSPPRFEEADRAFLERGDPNRARFAYRSYKALLESNRDDWEAGWRFAMAAYFVGQRLTDDEQTRQHLWAAGRDAGRHALALAPDCVPCHLFTAINMALYGESVGVVKMLFTVGEIRNLLERSYALDPGFAYCAAPRLLGLIDHKLPRLLGGDRDRSRRYFQEAIALDPDGPLNYQLYAELLEDENQIEEALRLARRGLAVPMPSADRVEDLSAYAALHEYVPQLERKLVEHQLAERKPQTLGVRRGAR
jgi:tetratricopeptide (TPR) repeat protein